MEAHALPPPSFYLSPSGSAPPPHGRPWPLLLELPPSRLWAPSAHASLQVLVYLKPPSSSVSDRPPSHLRSVATRPPCSQRPQDRQHSQ